MTAEQRISRRQFMKQHHKSSRLLEMWRIFSHNRLAMLGLVLFLILMVLVLFADVFADYNKLAIGTDPMIAAITRPTSTLPTLMRSDIRPP